MQDTIPTANAHVIGPEFPDYDRIEILHDEFMRAENVLKINSTNAFEILPGAEAILDRLVGVFLLDRVGFNDEFFDVWSFHKKKADS